jgi:hypothetical protein
MQVKHFECRKWYRLEYMHSLEWKATPFRYWRKPAAAGAKAVANPMAIT